MRRLLAMGLLCLSTALAQTPPNILLVIADDFGIDASPCYPATGAAKPRMPTLEALCAQGVVFENVWVNPVCTPTRATLLTGKYGFRTGVGTVDDLLSPDQPSLQDLLGAGGYATAVVGKWHLAGANPDLNHPAQMGVGFYSGFMSGGVRDYSSWTRVEQGGRSQSTTYTTTAFVETALRWVSAQRQPWFLWLAFNAPHTPFHLPPQGLYSQANLSSNQRDIIREPLPYYFAAAEAMDKELGRLLAALPSGQRENTLVLFIGDNGSPARVTQSPFQRQRSKGSIYEGGVRVPLIVAGAGVSRRGAREEALINGVDLFATVAEAAGYRGNTNDGVSFRPALTGEFGGREWAYTELFGSRREEEDGPRAREGWAIRDARYKLLVFADGTRELYDLSRDTGEQNNLLAGQPSAEIQAVARALEARGTQLRGR